MKRSVLLSSLSLLVVSAPALAQSVPANGSAPLPDIEFGATVHMQSVRVNGRPRASVTLTGGSGVQSRHEVGRDGLPAPVPIGRTFRNVSVRTTISATLLDPSVDAAVQMEVGAPAPASPNAPEDSP